MVELDETGTVTPIRAARKSSQGDSVDGVAPRTGRRRLLIGLEFGTAAAAVVQRNTTVRPAVMKADSRGNLV
jgi:hypothetical protein